MVRRRRRAWPSRRPAWWLILGLAVFAGSAGTSPVPAPCPCESGPQRTASLHLIADTAAPGPVKPEDLLIPMRTDAEPEPLEGCGPARETVIALLAELEPRVSAGARAEAQQFVSGQAEAGKAWSDMGVALLLSGDTVGAAWAGLNAVRREWRGELLANCGAFVYYLKRYPEALLLLDCAQRMGFRSPYLFESLAAVHHKLGQATEARAAIAQAAALAPDDPAIRFESQHLGGAPAGAPDGGGADGREPDAMELAIRELEARFDEVHALIADLAPELDRLYGFASREQMAPTLRTSYDSLAKTIRDMAKEPRGSFEDYQRRYGAGISRAQYQQVADMLVNGVLQQAATAYFLATDTMISLGGCSLGQEITFWAEVVGQDPPAFARELKGDDEMAAVRVEPRSYWDEYEADLSAAVRVWGDQRAACQDDACRTRVEFRYCQTWRQLHERLANRVEARYNRAALNFDNVATRKLLWAEREALVARDFAVRQIDAMHLPKPGSGAGDAHAQANAQMGEMMVKGLNEVWKSTVVRTVIDPDMGQLGITSWLNQQAQWFVSEREHALAVLAGMAQEIEKNCQGVDQAMLELLVQEQYQAYLEMLRERMASDLTAEWDPNMSCEAELGPWKASFDLSGKSSLGRGAGSANIDPSGKGGIAGSWAWTGNRTIDADVSFAEGEFAGATLGGGSSTSYGPFTGKGNVTLFAEKSSRTGKMDGGLVLGGSLGLGFKTRGGGVTCYPGSGSVKFYARAFVEDAMTYYRASSNPPR